MKDETRIVHAATEPRPLVRTVNPPIQKASTVILPNAAALYDYSHVSYGRAGLSTQNALCEALAEMEHGTHAFLYPSGLAAITGVLLALLQGGDRLLVAEHAYRPSRIFCDRVLKRFGVDIAYFPQTASAEEVAGLMTGRTRLVLLESPGSISMEMQDVPGIAAQARRRGVLTAIDNTWAAGLLFRPLDHGVDISLQSLTKYVGGHADVLMGSAILRDADLAKRLDAGMHHIGWSVSPEDAYLLTRSLRTLPVRLAQHEAGGLAVARWLREHPKVQEVLHPALPGARGHDLWARDFTGACGLFSLVLAPGSTESVLAVLDRLTLFGLGFSWGGHESLAIDCDRQRAFGLALPDYPGPILRLHVGLEDPQDLIADLEQALADYP